MSLFDDLPPRPRRRSTSAQPPGRASRATAGAARSAGSDNVESVGDLTKRIDDALKAFGRVAVVGEVSRPKAIASGHVFFTLKDASAALDAKIWRSQVERALGAIGGKLEDGAQVICHGTLDVYAPYGKHSLIVDRVEVKGIGALLAELERLKVALKDEGLFDRKRPLPRAPKRIGVVTSRDADAWRDFLRTRSLRWPGYPVRLVHSRVQGQAAAREIAAAIARLDASGVDVIVVCRGGGAIEDLWCFNEEVVARAAYASSVPIVTGVGHETDTTLIDLVADHRAHTPTDAAQTIIPDQRQLLDRLERAGGYLVDVMQRVLETRGERLERAARTRAMAQPLELVRDRERHLIELGRRSTSSMIARLDASLTAVERLGAGLERSSPKAHVDALGARLDTLGARLATSANQRLRTEATRLDTETRRLRSLATDAAERSRAKLDELERTLRSVSPLAVLERGYSITRTADGRVVETLADVAKGVPLTTIVRGGRIDSTVDSVDSDETDSLGGQAE